MDYSDINEQVARKLGIEFIPDSDPRSKDAIWHSLRCPNYSRSIAAAWEIVEKYPEIERIDEYGVKIKYSFQLSFERYNQAAVWEARWYHFSWGHTFTLGFGRESESPLSICRAFLELPDAYANVANEKRE